MLQSACRTRAGSIRWDQRRGPIVVFIKKGIGLRTRSPIPLYSSSAAGLSLIEILIALFVFLLGILGVLSIFPVAMNSAGRAIGETRANILTQSALAQLTADCKVAYESGTAVNNLSPNKSRELVRPAAATSRIGYFVTLIGGPGKYQSRMITADDSLTMTVTPDWTPVGTWQAPGDTTGDTYVITRLGLPEAREDETLSRSAFVRSFDASNPGALRAGTANFADVNNPTVDPLNWATSWYSPPLASGASPADSSPNTLQLAGPAGAWRGKLAVITGDPQTNEASGQVRLITGASGTQLDIFPDWAVVPKAGCTYEIRDRLGYFLLVTSGRAAGRIFRITGHTPDPVNGDLIVCDGANLAEIGLTEARRQTTSGEEFMLRNATSFTIVGSASFLCTVLPRQDGEYRLNAFGLPKTAEPQTGTDVYFTGGAEQFGSDYSAVCIFSDNGPYIVGQETWRLPVRVDVFVFMNYDSSKGLVDNRKAVGHMTGYIGRP